ncbi:HlyD family secretion protein [Nitratifractor sp.]
MSKKIGSILLVLLVIALIVGGYRYISYRTKNAVSDAAFIKSDRLSFLSFKVGGKVIRMKKEENDPVRKGELLARIDPTDLELKKAKLQHDIKAGQETIAMLRLKRKRLAKTLEYREEMAQSDVDGVSRRVESLAFRIDSARARLAKLQKDTERYRKMLGQQLIAEADYEAIQTERDALQDQISGMSKELDALIESKKKAHDAAEIARVSMGQVRELDKEIAAREQQLKGMHKGLAELKRQISYTRLYAPFDGVVAKKFFDAPKVLSKGAPVYAVTDPKRLYCAVLLSEKKLKGVRPGNHVTITVDALKGREYKGSVESIAPTSASTFSLVPRDIASGEFTKLDQRFVVRIKLDSIEGLRAGMGAIVAIRRR